MYVPVTAAVAASLTRSVALALPLDWVIVLVVPQVEPPSVEYSKPVTAATEISAVRLEPAIVNHIS